VGRSGECSIAGRVCGLALLCVSTSRPDVPREPDILSFDDHEGLELFFSDRDAISFAQNGGMVAYGLIPTLQDLRALRAERIFARWLTLASLAGDPEQFAWNAMVTATCGLGLLTPASVGALAGTRYRLPGLSRWWPANPQVRSSD